MNLFLKNFENIRILKIKLNLKKIFIIFVFFISLLIFLSIIYTLNNYFLRSITFSLLWFFVFYWLINIFTFLYKKNQYTIFTRIIQRFWKRSLYLFWLLELFLFLIFLYLTLISPQEYLFLFDAKYNFISNYINFKSFFFNLLNIIIIILLQNILILLFKYNTFFKIYYFLLFIFLWNVLLEDLNQFLCINHFYSNTIWKWEDDYKWWGLELDVLKTRTYVHYIYLLIFLKFWHTIFIVGFFLFFENINLHNKSLSYNILSSNLQNFFFLLFFSFILKIIFIKIYMNYLYEYIYYWFFINYHFYDLNYFFQIFNYNYLFFIINDLCLIFL